MICRVNVFEETDVNPVTGKCYDDMWMAFCLTDSADYQKMVGRSCSGAVYTVRVSKACGNWQMAVCDFLQYCDERQKHVILCISDKDLAAAQYMYAGHRWNDPYIRDGEPHILVHSTTYESWRHICEDGCLKSWNTLRRTRKTWETVPIGHALGDPFDFRDDIMFSDGALAGELVVLSRQKGSIVMNPDMSYRCGVRLYFDADKLAEDGRFFRDGIHYKTTEVLPLQPYLLWYADWRAAGLTSDVTTPRIFTEAANRAFCTRFGQRLVQQPIG